MAMDKNFALLVRIKNSEADLWQMHIGRFHPSAFTAS